MKLSLNNNPKGHTSYLPLTHGADDPTITGDSRRSKPEERLLLAVIEQAWRDLSCSSEEMQEDAKAWFADRRLNREWSIEWTCSFLKMDADYLRRKIAEMRSRGELRNVRFYRTMMKASNRTATMKANKR